jgi:hypothetical protein
MVDVLALDKARVFQALTECTQAVTVGRRGVEKSDHLHCRLLRAHRKRPGSAAAQRCYQFPPTDADWHITLSCEGCLGITLMPVRRVDTPRKSSRAIRFQSSCERAAGSFWRGVIVPPTAGPNGHRSAATIITRIGILMRASHAIGLDYHDFDQGRNPGS